MVVFIRSEVVLTSIIINLHISVVISYLDSYGECMQNFSNFCTPDVFFFSFLDRQPKPLALGNVS